MIRRIPLYVPARLRKHLRATTPPAPPAPQPRRVLLAKPIPCGTRYPWGSPAGWLGDEAAALMRLAEAGGDLHAHRAVHLTRKETTHG